MSHRRPVVLLLLLFGCMPLLLSPVGPPLARADADKLIFRDPLSGSVITGMQWLEVDGPSDISSVSFFLDGGVWLRTMTGGPPWSIMIDTTLLDDGPHQFKATARRKDNSIVDRAKVSFIVANTIKGIVDGDDWHLPPGVVVSPRSGIYGYGQLNDLMTIQTPVLTWAELHRGDGEFDWSPLDRALERGPVVLRLKCGTPSHVPDHVIRRHRWSTFLNTEGQIELPQWSHGWLDEWRPFVFALGERYRHDLRLVGLQLQITASGEPYMNSSDIAGFEQLGLTPGVLREFLRRYHADALEAFAGAEWKVFSVIQPRLLRTYSGIFTVEQYAQAVRDGTLPFLKLGLGLRGTGTAEAYETPPVWSEWGVVSQGMLLTDDRGFPPIFMRGHLDGQVENWHGDNRNPQLATTDPAMLRNALRLSLLRAMADQYSHLWLDADDIELAGRDLVRYVQLSLGKRPEESPDALVVLGEFGVMQAWPRWLIPLNLDATTAGQLVDTSGLAWVGNTAYLGRTLLYDLQLDVDDRLLSTQMEGAVEVLVTYLDGDNSWYLEYAGPEGIVQSTAIEGQKTSTWKTVTFWLPRARFAGTLEGGADLRIVSDQGPLTIQLVRVIRFKHYQPGDYVVRSFLGHAY